VRAAARQATANVVPCPRCSDRDVAAVEAHQLLHEREADPAAFVRARARVLHPVEALEHLRQVGCRDPDARVLDRERPVLDAHRDSALET
jgi:hypothetical protein